MVLKKNKNIKKNKKKNKHNSKKLIKKLSKKNINIKGGNKKSLLKKPNRMKKLRYKKKRNKKTHKKIQYKNIKGGKRSALSKIIKDIRQSERSMLHYYKKYAVEANKYFKSYNKHVNNLAELDKNIPDTKSFKSIFINTLMPNHITNQMRGDSENPLFLSNYLIDDYSGPNDIQYQHIQQQIRYILEKNISKADQNLLDLEKIAIHNINENSISIDLVTAGYEVYEVTCLHDNLELNIDDLGLKIKSFVDKIKSGVEMKFKNVPEKREEIAESRALPAFGMQSAMQPAMQPGIMGIGPGQGMGVSPASNTSEALDAEKERKIQDILREMSPSNSSLGTGSATEDDKAFGKL
jgi:hypothetical protein